MNLDTLSYITDIKGAVSRVQSSQVSGSWVLLGYTDGDEGAKKLHLMTINVIAEGTVWRNLLSSFEEEQIQYAYAKLDIDAKGDMKTFLIHWVGRQVGEIEKTSCMPHLNEVRNFIPFYDVLITEMDALEIQSKVHSFLSRAQTICVETRSSCSEGNSEIFQKSRSLTLQCQRVSSSKQEGKKKLSLFSPRNKTLSPSRKGSSPSLLEEPEEETSKLPQHSPYPTLRRTKFKVAIIGSIGVGKTFIYLSYNDSGSALCAPDLVPSTIRADFMTKSVAIDQYRFSLEIWDTAGQERFMAFVSAWIRNAKVVLCVYDITDEDSFIDIPKWMETAREFADQRAIYFLVGNKADLDRRRIVQVSAAEKLATQHGMCFMECSGLTGYNILKLFECITRRVAFVYQDLLTHSMSKGLSDSTINLPVCERGTSYQGPNSSSRHRKKHISCQCN